MSFSERQAQQEALAVGAEGPADGARAVLELAPVEILRSAPELDGQPVLPYGRADLERAVGCPQRPQHRHVGGRLDGCGQPLLGDAAHTQAPVGLGKALQRSGQPFLAEDGRVDAVGQLAQLRHGGPQFRDRPRERLRIGGAALRQP